jgi:hypothetical protein
MKSQQIKSKILELCSEDAHGSWELFWSVSKGLSSQSKQELVLQFVQSVEDLINDKLIIPLRYSEGGAFTEVVFDRRKLSNDLELSDAPNPEALTWFEATVDGRRLDASLRSARSD